MDNLVETDSSFINDWTAYAQGKLPPRTKFSTSYYSALDKLKHDIPKIGKWASVSKHFDKADAEWLYRKMLEMEFRDPTVDEFVFAKFMLGTWNFDYFRAYCMFKPEEWLERMEVPYSYNEQCAARDRLESIRDRNEYI